MTPCCHGSRAIFGLTSAEGTPVFTYNVLQLEVFRWAAPAPLTPGKHTVVFDFSYDGPGFAKGGTGVLSVDGAEADRKTIPHTIAFLLTDDETFDVGVDTRSGVNDADYHVPFRFTGTINKLTVKPGPEGSFRLALPFFDDQRPLSLLRR